MARARYSRSNRTQKAVVRSLLRMDWGTRFKLALAALVGGGFLYAYEVQIQRPGMSFAGIPRHQDPLTEFTTRVFRNEAYMVGYSEWLGNPLWVTYQVLPRPDEVGHLPRPGRFQGDWRSLRCWLQWPCVDHDAYTGSGYDRGHMAPNHVIASRHGREAQLDTFLMTNISPQRPDLNRRLWQRIEELAAGDLVEANQAYWVVTGPIFGTAPRTLPGLKRIAIPEAFYKILIRPGSAPGAAPKVLAFIVPQTVRGEEDLRDFLSSVRDIEARTGLDFFHELDDAQEARVENAITPQAWGFTPELARRPPRY